MSWIILAAWAAALPQVRTEAGVYAVLFDLRYHGTAASELSLKDVLVPMPTLRESSADWLSEFDDVPSALREAASLHSPTKARPFDPALVPGGTKWISELAITRAFTGAIEENWAAFKRQHGARGWLSFSQVLFTADGLDALVYYEARCGGLCGEGGYAWLHRDVPQSQWSIRKRIIRWMS